MQGLYKSRARTGRRRAIIEQGEEEDEDEEDHTVKIREPLTQVREKLNQHWDRGQVNKRKTCCIWR